MGVLRQSFRWSALTALLLLPLAGCERETRDVQPPPQATAIPLVPTTVLTAGGRDDPPPDPRGARYEKNAFHVSEGQRLYEQFNCVGCHANGGGDIGPALIDDEWIYGGRIEQIAATIVQGQPNGMPSFRDKLTDEQVWQIAAYVRAMSGQLPRDVPPSRSDTMANTKSLSLTERQPVTGARSVPADAR